MKLTVKQSDLKTALSIVGRAVSSRTTIPVLSNVLLSAEGDQLKMSATNREQSLTVWIAATVEEEGAITIPARLLSDFVGSLSDGEMSLELVDRTQTLKIKTDHNNTNIKGIAALDFPKIATVGEKDLRINLDTPGLRSMIDQVTFAAGQDENRPILTGVEFKIEGNRLSMAATDGFRLALRSCALPGTHDDLSIIIPARSLTELARISSDANEHEPVVITIPEDRNRIIFQMVGNGDDVRAGVQRVEMVSELIDGRFPDYNGTIPTEHTTRTTVNTAALLKAVRVALLFARDNSNIIRLSMVPPLDAIGGGLRIEGNSPELGDNMSDIDAMVEGDEIAIRFNAKYIIDILTQVDDGNVVIETTVPTRPGLIRPASMAEEDGLFVIMPMHPPKSA